MTRTNDAGRPRRERGPVRTTLTFTPETAEAIRALAEDRNTTLAEVIRRAVRVEQFLHETQKRGGKVLVEDADRTIKELIIF